LYGSYVGVGPYDSSVHRIGGAPTARGRFPLHEWLGATVHSGRNTSGLHSRRGSRRAVPGGPSPSRRLPRRLVRRSPSYSSYVGVSSYDSSLHCAGALVSST